MKYCIHCGAELEDEDKFCVHCGLSQSTALEPDCQQGAVGQTPTASAPAAASKKPVNKAVIVLSVALAAALVVIVCLVLFMRPASDEGEASSANVASQQQTHDSGSNASSHDSKSSDSSVAPPKKESSSAQTEVSVRALSGFSGEMSTCQLSSYSASSVLPASEYGSYVASNLSDGDWSTAWVEGSSSSGVGQSVTVSRASGDKATVNCLELVAGYGKSTDIYYKNARPKQVSLIADSGDVVAQVTLADSYRVVQSISFPAVSTSSITLRIDSVYEGNKYDDCAISEMRCF